MALDYRRGVGRDLFDIGAQFLIGHHLHLRTLRRQRVPEALAGADEIAGRQVRNGADFAGGQFGLLVVSALILAVLVAQIVPIGADIGEPLGGRKIAVGDNGGYLLVDALVDFRRERVVPTTDHDDAGRVLRALGIDGGNEGREVDGGRTGNPHLDVERLPGGFQTGIDPLDEERKVGGIADPDILLAASAFVADRHV